MRPIAPLSRLEEKIGYVFQEKSILQKAFTHSTYTNLHGGENNERMEYLGDAVLGLIFTEAQYHQKDKQSEGAMTKQRQFSVDKKALLKRVESMGLAEYLRVEGSASNVSDKTYSSLYECLLAGIYLDGGYEEAKAFFNRFPVGGEYCNFKGELQEYLQKKKLPVPQYAVKKKTGRDDKPTFLCVASAQGIVCEGEGGAKREAEQRAAQKLLEALQKREQERL